ncbi:MAG: hypothetical protein HXS54_05955 [Theionarchaea archaeon]|nr:hypothetical protein [Theionarchaea archaeon]DBA34802.1 TPA_asm: hypothetical protein vir521_00008 [Caudoviricetes sp. vir521]
MTDEEYPKKGLPLANFKDVDDIDERIVAYSKKVALESMLVHAEVRFSRRLAGNILDLRCIPFYEDRLREVGIMICTTVLTEKLQEEKVTVSYPASAWDYIKLWINEKFHVHLNVKMVNEKYVFTVKALYPELPTILPELNPVYQGFLSTSQEIRNTCNKRNTCNMTSKECD